MGYGFDLVRLPAGIDRSEAYKHRLQQQEESFARDGKADRLGAIDPSKEAGKQRLAAALQKRHPTLEMFKHDYSRIAEARSIAESEARRLYRNLELNEKQLSIQILLFDDTAAVSFSFVGPPERCPDALHVLWDCLKTLELEGGFSVYDPQLGKIIKLGSDFELVRENACGHGK